MKERNVLQSFVGFMDIETVQKNKLGIGNSSEVDTNNFLNSGFCGIEIGRVLDFVCSNCL